MENVEKPNMLIPDDSLMGRLCASATAEWHDYTHHAFVRGLGDGTLPDAAFRHYLAQDYLFLIQFARAYGLAVYKADTIEEMRAASTAIAGILDVEMSLHVSYCASWGLTEAAMVAVPEDPACMAYTRFVLERGMAGDLLDLHVALAPCVVGYGAVGQMLAADPATRRDGNPYLSWIEMYSSDDYHELASAAVDRLDRIAARRGGAARFDDLLQTFRSATRLESGFWEMGLQAVA